MFLPRAFLVRQLARGQLQIWILVKRVSRFLALAICGLAMTVCFVVALFASFVVIAFFIAWHQEGRLLATEWSIVAKALGALLGAVALGLLSRFGVGALRSNKRRDNSFKLILSESGRPEKFVQEASDLIFFVVLAIGFWSVTPGRLVTRILSVAAWLIVGFVSVHLKILAHELAHLLAAWTMHFDLRKIQVGVGRLIWSVSLRNGLRCEWRAWPHGGFVIATDSRAQHFRLRQSIFIATGPISNILILCITYQLIQFYFGGLTAALVHNAGSLLLCIFFLWSALTTVGGLIPYRTWMDKRRVRTDGYLLWRLWTASRDEVRDFILNPDWREALQLLESTSHQPRSAVATVEVSEKMSNVETFREQQIRLQSRLLPNRNEQPTS